MNVTVVSINQSYEFNSKKILNAVSLQLPSGRVLTIGIDQEDATALLSEVELPEQPSRPAVERSKIQFDPEKLGEYFTPAETPVEERATLEHHVSAGIVQWETLPDTQLPPQMKQILKMSGLAPSISIEDLDRLKLELATRLSQRPQVGKVSFNSGPQHTSRPPPRRTVPMDEKGNPLPPGGIVDADPGENPDDEDGVQQV
jgi:hypothetical protein